MLAKLPKQSIVSARFIVALKLPPELLMVKSRMTKLSQPLIVWYKKVAELLDAV